MFKKFLNGSLNLISTIVIILGLGILFACLSLAWFTFGYWLITLILAEFFNYMLPFSYTYALGGWLISLIIGVFISPLFGLRINIKE